MDHFSAYAMGVASRGNPEMVFDWEKAARIIAERGALDASAGLRGDWEYTGGEILRAGTPLTHEDTYVFLASTWAVPELEIDGEIIECWRYIADAPGWDSGTLWPDEALQILNGKEKPNE